jgi:hypothetical protein
MIQSNDCFTNTEIAILYRAIVRLVVVTIQRQRQPPNQGKKMPNQSINDRILPIIMDLIHPNIIQNFAYDICQLIVLSSTSASNNTHDDKDAYMNDSISITLTSPTHRLLCHVFAMHLSRTHMANHVDNSPATNNIEHGVDDDNDDVENDDEDDDDDDAVIGLNQEIPMVAIPDDSIQFQARPLSPLLLLYQTLCQVAATWSQITFIFQTETFLQHHITGFLLSGLSILIQQQQTQLDGTEDTSNILYYTTLSTKLIEGITHRLASNLTYVRHDGMYIAQHVASLLGQPDLKFDELLQHNDHNQLDTGSQTSGNNTAAATMNEQEYDDKNNDATMKDDDSTWDSNSETLEPYDIEDDREDLRTAQRPLYLSECLDYLRSSETDDNEYDRHQIALQDISRLARTRPADLKDYGPELARTVLRLENKYNMENFTKLVSESLHALVVEDPIAVGVYLIEELFEDGSLRDRLTILHALDDASTELSGNKPFENDPSVKHRLDASVLPSDLSRVAGKREIVSQQDTGKDVTNTLWNGTLDERTRRWGAGRHPVVEPTRIDNHFANVAPDWFYLLSGRFMNCRDNVSLWGGEVGATLLSSFLLTLGRIVSCAGPYTPGVDVLAQDLWELAWPLRRADVAEVRSSVLYAVGTSFCFLPEQRIFAILMDTSNDSLITNIKYICENDNDRDCRVLANQLQTTVVKTFGAMDNLRLLR